MGQKIKCPKCGNNIDINDALYSQMEKDFMEKNKAELEKIKQEFAQKEERLKEEKEKIKEKAEEDFRKRMQEYRKEAEREIKNEIENEMQAKMKKMKEDLKEKNEELKKYYEIEAENEKLKREKELISIKAKAEMEKQLTEKLSAEKEKIKEEIFTEATLKSKEKDKKIEELTKQIEELSKKAAQGSVQLQGEAQEMAIEEVLKEEYRFDIIEPVKTGTKGADIIHKVKNEKGNVAGIIYYESKRTKDYESSWIDKLKEDGRKINADILVLVTQAFPKDKEKIFFENGVLVCRFADLKWVSMLLRLKILALDQIKVQNTDISVKSDMLYKYLTGQEFKNHIEVIIENFKDLRESLYQEQVKAAKMFKEREKYIEKIVISLSGFAGSVKGIVGSSMPEIEAIEKRKIENK